MTGQQPLVAKPVDDTKWYSGISQFEDAKALSDAVKSGDWIEAGLSAAPLGMDLAMCATDPMAPLGILVQAGVGWLLEHVKPLREALDKLAGNPAVVKSFGQTWQNIADRLNEVAEDFSADVRGDLPEWAGDAADAYRKTAVDRTDALRAAAETCSAVASAVTMAGEVVTMVRVLVRDLISALVSALIEAVLPPGPGTVRAAVKVIRNVLQKVVQVISKLVRSLAKLAKRLPELMQQFANAARRLHPRRGPQGGGTSTKPRVEGDSPTVHKPDGTTSTSSADVPDAPATRAPDTPNTGGTTSSQNAEGGLFSRIPEKGKPQPWPPERRDPNLDHWDGPGESGRLKVTPDNIRKIAEKYGIRLHPNARVVINKSLRGVYGETVPTGQGARIELAPGAFVNEEQLARTLYHENMHVEQLARNGWRYPPNQAGHDAWENEAHAGDKQWWDEHPNNRGQVS